MRFFFLSCVLAFMTVGAGCQQVMQQWTSDTPIAATPTRTGVVTVPSLVTSTKAIVAVNWRQPYVLSVVSEDESLHAQLTVAGERVIGRFQTAAQQEGEVYGAASTSTGQLTFALYLPASGEAFARATSTWSGDGSFVGEITLADGKKQSLSVETPAAEAAQLTFQLFQQEWRPDVRSGCEFSVLIPTVEAKKGISVAAASRMNTEIKKAVLYRHLSTAQIAADAYLRDCKATVSSLKKTFKATEEVGGALQGSQDTSVQLTLNQAGRLSFLIDQYEYAGGAHGNTVRSALVFDTKTGQRLSLKDLVQPAGLKPFLQRETQEMLNLYQDLLFDETVSSSRAFLADVKTTSTEAEIKQFGALDNFFLTPTNLVFFYQPYDIAPYAVGLPEVPMAYKRWQNLAK